MEKEDIKVFIRQEIAECFSDIKRDIAEMKATNLLQSATLTRIENGLFGDGQFIKEGMTTKTDICYEYVKKNKDSKIIERAEQALDDFKFWKTNQPIFQEILDRYKAMKWLFALMGISSIVGLLNIVAIIIDLLSKVN
jgi:hypothetical protein